MTSIYALYATTEGQSQHSIDIVANSVRYLAEFLAGHGATTDAREISHMEIRAFIIYLERRRCFENHPTTHPQTRGLSGHTINTYVRSIRGFFSWLESEGVIAASPFEGIKVPPAPRKVIATFTETQIKNLLHHIDTTSVRGYRDYTMILVLLDSGIPIIMLTSVGHDLNKRLAASIGASGYIVKPFMIDDLNNKINETLQSH